MLKIPTENTKTPQKHYFKMNDLGQIMPRWLENLKTNTQSASH